MLRKAAVKQNDCCSVRHTRIHCIHGCQCIKDKKDVLMGISAFNNFILFMMFKRNFNTIHCTVLCYMRAFHKVLELNFFFLTKRVDLAASRSSLLHSKLYIFIPVLLPFMKAPLDVSL